MVGWIDVGMLRCCQLGGAGGDVLCVLGSGSGPAGDIYLHKIPASEREDSLEVGGKADPLAMQEL